MIALIEQVESIEVEITKALWSINDADARRPRAKRHIEASWRRGTERVTGAFPDIVPGVLWRVWRGEKIESDSTRLPDMHRIGRAYRPEVVNSIREARDGISQKLDERNRILAALESMRQTLKGIDKQSVPTEDTNFTRPPPRALPEQHWSRLRERRSLAVDLVARVKRLGELIDALEPEIENWMIEINRHGKRNRNLLVEWRIGKSANEGITLTGPICSQVYKGAYGRRDKRYIGALTGQLNWDRVRANAGDTPATHEPAPQATKGAGGDPVVYCRQVFCGAPGNSGMRRHSRVRSKSCGGCRSNARTTPPD